jgi:Flp pilus assembly protein TadG
MRIRLGDRLRVLAGDSRGASVIEFALFAPILALMVMGISDVAMGYSRTIELEQAAFRALEKVAVGNSQSGYDYLRAEAATAAGVSQDDVTVETWLECNGTRQTDFAGVCATGETIVRYVEITIDSSYDPSFDYGPLATAHAGTDGTIPISASASLRIQ